MALALEDSIIEKAIEQKPTAGYKFAAVVLVSLVLITFEAYTRFLDTARDVLYTLTLPVRFVGDLPHAVGSGVWGYFSDRNVLMADLERLRRENILLSYRSQELTALRSENARLKQLYPSVPRFARNSVIGEITGLSNSPSRHEVVIDKGLSHGIRVGHAVLDKSGVYGQVIESTFVESRVLQLTDVRIAVPVVNQRTQERAIASGIGSDVLVLEHISNTADFRVGDQLLTSGLGGLYPADYAVGTIVGSEEQVSDATLRLIVDPAALLLTSRHLVVLLDEDEP